MVRNDCGYRVAGEQGKDSESVAPASCRLSRGHLGLAFAAIQMSKFSYGTQSPIKMFVSCGAFAFRFEAHTSFFPSGENIGKPSNPSL